MKKKAISILLIICLIFSICPTIAHAEELEAFKPTADFEIQLNGYASEVIGLKNDKTAVLIYTMGNSNNMEYFLSIYDNAGNMILNRKDITSMMDTRYKSMECQVYALSNGNILVTYNKSDTSEMNTALGTVPEAHPEAYFMILNPTGEKVVSQVQINTENPGNSLTRAISVTELSNGNLAFSWQRNDNSSIASRIFTMAGTPVTQEVLINSGYNAYRSFVSANPNGTYMVCYDYYASSASPATFYGKYSVFRNDGTSVVTGTVYTSTSELSTVNLLTLSDGNFAVIAGNWSSAQTVHLFNSAGVSQGSYTISSGTRGWLAQLKASDKSGFVLPAFDAASTQHINDTYNTMDSTTWSGTRLITLQQYDNSGALKKTSDTVATGNVYIGPWSKDDWAHMPDYSPSMTLFSGYSRGVGLLLTDYTKASDGTFDGTYTTRIKLFDMEDSVPSVAVAAQSGPLSALSAGTATFAVTTSSFTKNASLSTDNYSVTWYTDAAGTQGASQTAPAGITLTKTSASLLTVTTDSTAQAGSYYFKLTAADGSVTPTETATSGVAALTIGKINAAADMKTAAANISNLGKTGATVTLPALPAGASYGTPTYAGSVVCSNASASGTTLTFDAAASTAGQTGTITVPVTGAKNYNNYDITVTITSVAKTQVTITGLTAADGTYSGSAVTGYTGTPSGYTRTLSYTYYLADGTTETTTANSGAASEGAAPVNAGSYRLTVSVPESDETYTGAVSLPFTIAKAPVSFTVSSNAFNYDAAAHTAAVAQTAGETPSAAGKYAVAYQKGAETAAASKTNVGEYSIIITLTDSNLKFSGQADDVRSLTLADKLTIRAVNYSGITWPTASALTYGQALSASALTGGAGDGTFAWKTGATVPTVGNSGYPVVFTPTDTNYAPAEQTVAVTVAPKELTISGTAATSRAYNGTTTVAVTGGSLQGVVGTDEVTLVSTNAAGSVTSADAGAEKAVTVTGYTLDGAAAGNYTLTQPTGLTVFISKAEGSGSVGMAGWTYGGTASEPVPVSATNGTDGVSYTYAGRNGTIYASNAAKPAAAGDYTVTAVFPAVTNYNGAAATADFTIAKAASSIAIAENQTKEYNGSAVTAGAGGADILYAYNGDGAVTVTWYADSSGTMGGEISAPANAGTYWIGVSAAAGTNYAAADETVQKFTITRASITPVVTMADYVYGTTPIAPSLTGNSGGGAVTYDYSTDSTNVNKEWTGLAGTTLDAGVYYMKASVAETANYAAGTSEVRSFRVIRAKYAAPSAPTVSGYAVTVAEADRSKGLEYSLDSGATWAAVPTLSGGAFTLTGLTENKGYTISLRVLGDKNHFASDPSGAASFTTPASYSVAYNANCGTGTVPATVTRNSGSVAVASGSGLTRTGYTFGGWNTKADGSGMAYAAGSTISTGATLYAQWTVNAYTVKFNANSGTGTMTDESFVYDTAQTLTENVFVKDGYHFAGWAASATGAAFYSDKQSVKNLTGSGSVTLYAVWAQNVYEVSGTVNSESNTTVTVKLMRGSAQISSTTPAMSTNAPYTGTFSFTGVVPGTYNVVATQGEKTMTQIVDITSASQSGLAITMPAADVSSVLTVAADTPAVVVGKLDAEAVTKAETGKTVTITMIIESVEEQSLPAAAAEEALATQKAITEIKDKAPNAKLEYMNIDVTMTVNAAGSTETTEKLAETNNVVELVIPYDMTGKTDIKMYRYHDDAVQTFAKLDAKPADGSALDATYYLDAANGLIYAYGKLFSTYAIGYTATAPVIPSGTAGGSGTSAYSITASAANNGAVKLSASSAAGGTKVTVTLTPDSGYTLKSLTIKDAGGSTVSYTDNKNGTYTFTMPASAVTVSAAFSKLPTSPDVTGVSALLQIVDHIRYINGYPNGTIGPERNMTRGEAAQLFFNLLLDRSAAASAKFSDVPDALWCAKAINKLAALGVIKGYDNGAFGLNDPITREQFCAMAVRFAAKVKTGSADGTATFSDVKSGMWSYGSVMTAASLGWISGYADGSFGPGDNITRAQVVTIVNHMLSRAADKGFVDFSAGIRAFSDLSKSHWAYYDLMEAANAHDYKAADGSETWSSITSKT
jgi:uncharacterized repeat protein (TIGR02543 family)